MLLRHNVITGQPEFRVPERDEFEAMGMKYPTGAVPLDEWRSATQWYGVCDRFVATLYNMLSVGKEVREQDIWRVIKSDFASLYNPFQQYLSRLPPWDESTNPILELSMTVTVRGGTEEQLLFYVCLRKPGEPGVFVSSAEILMNIGGNLTQRLTTNRLGRAMTALGFRRVRSHNQWGYIAVAYSADEIKGNRSVLAHDAETDPTAVTMEEIMATDAENAGLF